MRKFHYGILAIPFILLLWVVAASHFPALVFPGPISTMHEFWKQLQSPSYYGNIGISLYRLFYGFIIATLSAFIVGIFAGVSRAFRQFLTPMVTFFQATPPMAWAPLFILMFALGDAPMVAVIVIAAFFPIVTNVIHGMEQIKETHIRAAQSLGASRFQLAVFVMLPEVMPTAFTGITVGFGIAWRSLVAAEMIGGTAGIGWLITSSAQVGNSSLVIVGILTIGILAMLFEFALLRPLKQKFAGWAPRS